MYTKVRLARVQPASALPFLRRRNINKCWSIDRSKCMFWTLRWRAASLCALSSSTSRKNFSLPIWKSRSLSSNAAFSCASNWPSRVRWCLLLWWPLKHMSKACLHEWVRKLTTSAGAASPETSSLGGGGGSGEVGVNVGIGAFVSDERRRFLCRWAHSTRTRLCSAHAWWRLVTSLRRFSEWRSCCLSCKESISLRAVSWATKHCRRLFSLRRAFNTSSTCIFVLQRHFNGSLGKRNRCFVDIWNFYKKKSFIQSN